MKKNSENLAKSLMDSKFVDLSEVQQHVIESIANQEPITSNANKEFQDQLTFGQRLADRVAEFGGSWTFILIFVGIMVIWMTTNVVILSAGKAFDPYPFILLNLALSSLAALQAPIIMMSQNRQSTKDRHDANLNYEVSLKTDLEIIRLHQKLDALSKKLCVLDKPENK